jgi:hypothetical protein
MTVTATITRQKTVRSAVQVIIQSWSQRLEIDQVTDDSVVTEFDLELLGKVFLNYLGRISGGNAKSGSRLSGPSSIAI